MATGVLLLGCCLIVGIGVRIFNGVHAYRLYLFQKNNTDFSRAEAFTIKANPEHKKCLLIHGITGSADEMRNVGKYLQKLGISSHCPKLLGHGTSFYDVEKYRMQDWAEQIRAEAKKDKYDFLIGLCAGANIAVDLAVENSYEKIVLLSPLFKYPLRMCGLVSAYLIPLLHPIYRYYPKRPIYHENMIAYKILPTINVWDLYHYNKLTMGKLDNLKTKTLVLFGGEDDLYHPSLPQNLARKIANAQVEIVPGSQHVLPMDQNREKIFKLIEDFLLQK